MFSRRNQAKAEAVIRRERGPLNLEKYTAQQYTASSQIPSDIRAANISASPNGATITCTRALVHYFKVSSTEFPLLRRRVDP